MSEQKRYVVRGKGTAGVEHAVSADAHTTLTHGWPAPRLALADAVKACCFMIGGGFRDVQISRVADDGAETPLPTYEEAIGRLTAIAEDAESAIAWHRQPGGMRPNHPPELAGCPTSALKYLLRLVRA